MFPREIGLSESGTHLLVWISVRHILSTWLLIVQFNPEWFVTKYFGPLLLNRANCGVLLHNLAPHLLPMWLWKLVHCVLYPQHLHKTRALNTKHFIPEDLWTILCCPAPSRPVQKERTPPVWFSVHQGCIQSCDAVCRIVRLQGGVWGTKGKYFFTKGKFNFQGPYIPVRPVKVNTNNKGPVGQSLEDTENVDIAAHMTTNSSMWKFCFCHKKSQRFNMKNNRGLPMRPRNPPPLPKIHLSHFTPHGKELIEPNVPPGWSPLSIYLLCLWIWRSCLFRKRGLPQDLVFSFTFIDISGSTFVDNTKDKLLLFRWFEELGPICELLEKASEIEVSGIKSPIGSIFQKYVYSSFMVKMRIDLGPFGLFWFILGWG